jgi:hypothetical protein
MDFKAEGILFYTINDNVMLFLIQKMEDFLFALSKTK